MRYYNKLITLLICTFSIFMLYPVFGESATSAGDRVTWEGNVDLDAAFTVKPSTTLIVEPGTNITIKPLAKISIKVLGRIEVRGEKDNPVTFQPSGDGSPGTWGGISLVDSKGNMVKHCMIKGASSGISLVRASARIISSTFKECRKGVEINQKSLAKVDGSTFSSNLIGLSSSISGRGEIANSLFDSVREVGVVVQNGGSLIVDSTLFAGGKKGVFALTNAPVVIKRSTFSSFEQGVIFRQAGKNSIINRSSFENNTTGLLSVQFASETVEDCTFKNNRVALDVREFSSPHITHNLISGNELGLNLFRKSNPLFDFNVLRNNRTAIIIDYSSYPGIFENNFVRNHMNIELGKFQSGDWEKRAGSKEIAGKEAARRGSRNAAAFGRNIQYPGRVNARKNFWGADLGEPGSIDLNMEKIRDGKDFGPVSYKGYGDEKYRIDIVDFSEWRRAPVPSAGPKKGGK